MVESLELHVDEDDIQASRVTPWFSYQLTLPIEPVPPVSKRPHIKTDRLVVRPLALSDLEAFHKLRSDEKLQCDSISRGRADRDMQESQQNLSRLQTPYDEGHWYFGAFLASTGELIGEGGIPDIDGNTRSGWVLGDFLIAPEYQRQGYGTELFNAVLDSWWALPRERRRRQLNPLVVPGKEPGDDLTDKVIFSWEISNHVATGFFTKVLGHISLRGSADVLDTREGRKNNLVNLYAWAITNPIPFVDSKEAS